MYDGDLLQENVSFFIRPVSQVWVRGSKMAWGAPKGRDRRRRNSFTVGFTSSDWGPGGGSYFQRQASARQVSDRWATVQCLEYNSPAGAHTWLVDTHPEDLQTHKVWADLPTGSDQWPLCRSKWPKAGPRGPTIGGNRPVSIHTGAKPTGSQCPPGALC